MEKNMFSVEGKTALVTGSSRGIGRALAVGLAQYGADLAVNYTGRQDEAEETARQVRAFGRKCCVVQANLAEADAPCRLFEQSVASLGRIDILVLNASVQIRRKWSEIPLEEYEQQMNVNLRASMQLMQLAIPPMMERGWGRVVTVGSVQQQVPHPDMLVYAASKCAQLSMVRNIAKQVAPYGVTVNNLAPGVIDTDRNKDALSDPGYREKVIAKIPTRFVGLSEDCVGATLLLCSDAGRYITGMDYIVDGGMSLP
jgi:NAD(P)-dependent dehydrogenase (short-subunit alcohol dehydrogenase family)